MGGDVSQKSNLNSDAGSVGICASGEKSAEESLGERYAVSST